MLYYVQTLELDIDDQFENLELLQQTLDELEQSCGPQQQRKLVDTFRAKYEKLKITIEVLLEQFTQKKLKASKNKYFLL